MPSVLSFVLAGLAATGHAQMRVPLEAVPFTRVRLADPWLAPRSALARSATLPACLEQCERTGRVRNFAVAAGKADASGGGHVGNLYDDSDVYKVIEAAAGVLALERDAALQARVDGWIESIAAAQREDGYLNTYYQLVEPAQRWQNLEHGHELYCAGHLIEAAVAYAQATGRERLLEVARKFADLIAREFGPEKRQAPCGHPEIELALVKLARFSGEARHAELARFFVEQRGQHEGQHESRRSYGEYSQDHLPIREQRAPRGHAVRAMYLYSGALDVARWFQDATLLAPQEELWRDLLEGHFYVTGGIGSRAANEGFGAPFVLPNDTAYCETCASIGMLLWNQRLFLATGRTVYADVLERELYNAIPAGLSASGDRFFYDNPLASRGEHQRVPWFGCSCCPTNLARTLPSVSQYVYAQSPKRLAVVLYAKSSADLVIEGTPVRVVQTTDMPYDGQVTLAIEPERPVEFELWLRVPNWAAGHAVLPPPLPSGAPLDNAFPREVKGPGESWRVLTRTWKRGDRVNLKFDLEVERRTQDPKVEAGAGRVALQRGPLIYCLEGHDNQGHARSVVLKPEHVDIQSSFRADLLGGTQVLTGKCERLRNADPFVAITAPGEFLAIPYAQWANRGASDMTVWIPETPELAERPGEGLRLERGSNRLLRASHCFANDTLAALDDGQLGRDSADAEPPRTTFWPHRGTTEWVEVVYRQPRSVRGLAVQWFDDTGRGACRVPQSWRIQARTTPDGAWQSVTPTRGELATAKDALHEVAFEPRAVLALRLEIVLQPEQSAGLLEWRVDEGQ